MLNITGASVMAYLATYWEWYWQTFNLAGFAIAFLVSIIVLPSGAILTAVARDKLSRGKVSSAGSHVDRQHVLDDITLNDQFGGCRKQLNSGLLSRLAHISFINLEFSKLEEDLWIMVVIMAYNASQYELAIEAVDGNINYLEIENNSVCADTKQVLPTPRLLTDNNPTRGIAPFSEFLIALEQRVPRALASRIMERIGSGQYTHFILNDLAIGISAGDEQAVHARLKVWNGVAVYNRQEAINTGRIIEAAGFSSLEASDSI